MAVALVPCVLFVALPSGSTVARDLLIIPLSDLAVVLAIIYGVHRFSPRVPAAWLLIAAGIATYCVGDLIWGVQSVQGRDPFPSAADIFYLPMYPLLAAGLYVAIRRREVYDRRVAIDAALVVAAAFLLSWVYVIRPVVDDGSLSQVERYVSIAYPVGDLLLLALAVRFLMGASWHVLSLLLLVLGLFVTLLGDLLFSLDVLGRVPGDATDGVLLVGTLLIGLAALHPTMTALTEERGQPAESDSYGRLFLLLAISLVPAAVLVVQAALDEPLYLPAVIAAMVVISVLSTARFNIMARRALRAAHREALLSAYAEELMGASSRDQLLSLAERTANTLVGSGRASVVLPPTASGEGGSFVAPVEVRGEQVAMLVADASQLELQACRSSLEQVAAALALALEREQLLATERAAAATLAEQNERLVELDKMKDQFVSSVSHELRTPLTSMVGYLEIMRGGGVGELTSEQQRVLEIVDRNSHRLNQLVEDILVAARIESGRFKLEPRELEIGALIAERVESIRGTAAQKPVELRVALEAAPPLWADPIRLGQVIDNLLSNAVKFTPAGGTVTVELHSDDGAVRVVVSDTGVGIPAAELDQLFGRFFRASTAGTVQGTGLGLSIAKAIVESHGGTITVTSEEGAGTTFSASLPVQSPLEGAPDTLAGAGAHT